MKILTAFSVAILTMAGAIAGHAGSRSSTHYEIAVETLGSGGRAATANQYAHRGNLGAVSGTTALSRDARVASKSGFLGSLYEIVGLRLEAPNPPAREGDLVPLVAHALLDDETTLELDPSRVAWSSLDAPVVDIDERGQARIPHVYEDVMATIQGAYQNLLARLDLPILNVNEDDFGTYADDGLSDAWQVEHFGQDNPDAVPEGDPDRDRQSNQYEHTAGTNPMDPDSRFRLRIARAAGLLNHIAVIFEPVSPDRKYTVLYQTELPSPGFVELEDPPFEDHGLERTVWDINPTDPARFYHVRIDLP